MRSLAAFIMRGRASAALVAASSAVLFLVFPPFLVVSGAAIALVTLRQGATAGIGVMALGGLAAVGVVSLAWGEPWPLVRILVPCWLAVWLLALVLRETVSLPRMFHAAAALGVVGLLGFYFALGDPTLWWPNVLENIRRGLSGAAAGGTMADGAGLDDLLVMLKGWAPYLPGQVISALLWLVLAAVLLGRWWQATLFNPGGFRAEFHALRLGWPLALFTLAVFGIGVLAGWPPLSNVALILGALYTIQGIALVHAILFKLQLSPAWLVLFYLLLVPLLSQAVMALGVADAWADFRQRIRPRSSKH
ncbi:MAG: DUF2232 domain-containing protein [Candidatus Competibacter denitrificans]